jgi:hypothetical protein
VAFCPNGRIIRGKADICMYVPAWASPGNEYMIHILGNQQWGSVDSSATVQQPRIYRRQQLFAEVIKGIIQTASREFTIYPDNAGESASIEYSLNRWANTSFRKKVLSSLLIYLVNYADNYWLHMIINSKRFYSYYCQELAIGSSAYCKAFKVQFTTLSCVTNYAASKGRRRQ